jgi:peptide subunit release factor RF-3
VRTASVRLSSARQCAAASAIDEAWPGDVIGVMDRGTLRIGIPCRGEGLSWHSALAPGTSPASSPRIR